MVSEILGCQPFELLVLLGIEVESFFGYYVRQSPVFRTFGKPSSY
jgi:hypothetical protein